MANDATITIRCPTSYLDRADALAADLETTRPDLAAVGKLTRAAVLRLALAEGLAALEAGKSSKHKASR